MVSSAKTGEQQAGRFRKGQSGNPAGRPRGSRNTATMAAEAMLGTLTDLGSALVQPRVAFHYGQGPAGSHLVNVIADLGGAWAPISGPICPVLGGGAGSLARYLVGSAIEVRFGGRFPWGTLVVNVTGSFLIGLIVTLLTDRVLEPHPYWRLALVVGFLGGYTTFSSFEFESFKN